MPPVDLRTALTPRDGQLSVDGAGLGSDRITAVFTGLLPGGVLRLNPASAQPGRFALDGSDVDAVQVTGTLVPEVLGVAQLSVNAWFFLVGGVADVFATLTGVPDPWSPPVSFPATAGSALAGARFGDCTFKVDSRPRPGLGPEFDAVLQDDPGTGKPAATLVTAPAPRAGLSLSAQLDLGSLDETLADFVQIGAPVPTVTLPMSGNIEVVGDRPRMWLRTTTPVASFTFQSLSLSVDYEILTAPVRDATQAVVQEVRERLVTTLKYQAESGPLSLPLAAAFDPDSLAGGVTLSTVPETGDLLSLQTLAGLIPADVGSALSAIPQLGQLTLTGFALEVTGWPVRVASARVQLSAPGKWPIVPDLVEFDGLGLDLTVTQAGDSWELLPVVTADFELAHGRLTGAVDLAAQSWLCVLKDDSVIDIQGLIEDKLQLSGALPPNVPADFEVTRFEIRGDEAAGTHTVDVATSLGWQLDIGAAHLMIEGFFVTLEYAGDGGPTGTLGGTMVIGPVTVTVTAAYEQDGLTFEVTAYDLPLTQLVADILGDQGLKDQLPDVNFALLDLSVTWGTGEFSVQARGDIDWKPPFGVTGLSLRNLAIDVSRGVLGADGKQPVKASLSGNLQLTADQPYVLMVTADLESGGGGLRFTGATPSDGPPIPIGQLINGLAKRFGDGVTLPGALTGLEIKKLAVTIDTAKKSFGFELQTSFPIEGGKEVAASITIDLTQVDGKYTGTFGGRVTVGALEFDLHFAKTPEVMFCVATYQHLAAAGQPASIRVRDIVADLSADVADLIPADLEIDIKDVILALGWTEAGTRCLFGLDVGARLALSGLPLVGQEFGADSTAGIDNLRLLVATGDLRRSDVATINSLIPAGIAGIPMPPPPTAPPQAAAALPQGAPAPSQGAAAPSQGAPALPQAAAGTGGQTGPGTEDDVVLTSGPLVSATLAFGDASQTLALPVSATTPARSTGTGTGTGGTTGAATPADGTKWFTVQRTFGPVHLARVGVQYRDSVLWFMLDAALSALGLTLSLDGLGVGSPITSFDPRFTLRGLGVDYRNAAVEIGAAFLHTTVTDAQGRTYDEYDGAAVLKAQGLTLSAIGSYAYLDGHPSLFVYAVLEYPLGGPAFFFVTGLAAGFGYNRDLIVPPIDQVAQFPLVSEATKGAAPAPPPAKDSPSPSPAERVGAELALLRNYIPPSTGSYFLAVGIRFTSFQMVDSFVLLTVLLGNRVEVNVLGLSTLVAPVAVAGQEAIPPLAVIQMAVKASFVPDEGFLGVAAQLTAASYVLAKDCHLTGGFAFWCWFPTPIGTPPTAGDFVLTLGGYHPDFPVPAHYPRVPRVGVNWKVSDQLAVKGELYFALTPAALMAGVLVDATWDGGDLQAWFHAGADFIVAWKPYHYDAHAFATLRVSYRFELFGTHEIRVDASADLHLWGPEFSGRATIKVSVIEFDITFGAGAVTAPDPIGWAEFRGSFLPAPASDTDNAIPCCSISVTDGLVRAADPGTGAPPGLGVVNPKQFALTAGSVIPSTAAFTGTQVDVGALALNRVGVAPMAVVPGALTSELTIKILLDDGAHAEDQFSFTPIVKPVPAALWGSALTPDLNAEPFVERSLAGFTITPHEDAEPAAGTTVQRDDWQYADGPVTPAYQWEPAPGDELTGPQATADSVRSTIDADGPEHARARLLAALGIDTLIAVEPSIADEFITT
ncbi:MAG TPA: DUF6603 domain-containing protein [Streptosporangiaceae bacterium]|nr:DUF6603 domain-containing protein [Streptosporangiaceae bacterium]